tara:strand:+ start:560 stop:874 length:315 start_codon:yes stop_codon:yes gene_type:complete
MPAPTTTPWGPPQTAVPFGDHIWSISTASHGGFFLDAEANARIPKWFQDRTFNAKGRDGWYEEDSDAALVVVFHAEHFPSEGVLRALTMGLSLWAQFAAEKKVG